MTPFFPELFVPWEEVTPDEIAAFENALNGARIEADMQHFLEDHPRMLIQLTRRGRGVWVIPQKRLGAEYVPDFLLAEEASGGLRWYAVELERPQAKMFKKNGDPSLDLTHALRQISDWRDWLLHNRDYAIRPPEESGQGLIDIDPELEGLIIIGRDSDIDKSTTARRRRLARTNRIEIETYDWLLYQARERLAVRAEQTRDIVAETLDSLAIYARRIEPPARKAVREVFGEIFSTTERTSATREIDWKGVYLWPDNPDLKVALQIVYARTRPAGYSLNHYDWTDWIEHVRTGIGEAPSLLVTESEPADDLQGRLTLEQDGIWYEIEWFQLRPDKEPLLQRLSILVHLPPAISYEEKRSRVAVARGVFERYVALERERALEQKRRDERAILSLSLTPGDMVIHDKFGLGTVISVYGSGAEAEARIDFGEDYGVKHLVLRYSPLKKL